MGRLAWSQLRFAAARMVALLAGMLLATTAFTVLTAASRTQQLRTVGTVSAHFVPAYEILVRPKGARTSLEVRTGTVQPNFLAGTYGGITMAQYQQIAAIPGVQVAAPVAMVGYTLLQAEVAFPVPAASYARPGRQLYRVATTWVSARGTTRIPQPASYVYITPNRLRFAQQSLVISEVFPGGHSVRVCGNLVVSRSANPFGVAAQDAAGGLSCWSKANGWSSGGIPGLRQPTRPMYYVSWTLPVLIAAIDPDAEAKLDGLDHAVVQGSYLAENAGDSVVVHDPNGRPQVLSFPVLASSSIGMDEYALTRLQALPPPTAPPPAANAGWLAGEATGPGRTVVTVRTSAQQAYQRLLGTLRFGQQALRPGPALSVISGLWQAGPVRYRRAPSGALAPLLVVNPPSAWYTGGIAPVAMDNADNQYRAVTVHAPGVALAEPQEMAPGATQTGAQLAGVFDPAKVRSFDPLSRVPLGLYQPVAAAPANAVARNALHGRDLLPSQNLGGYVTQPVDLITTLSALPALESNPWFGAGLPGSDPVSVIRVRVAGVRGPDPVSLERIRQVAQQIVTRTHLAVDIVAGSSPAPTTIGLPAGKFGQPPLALSEGWVKKGVAIAILTAVNKNSLVLFTLILVVCVVFVANSASVAVRGRRRELGVLACLGWTRPRLFAVVLGELAAIGLTAGVLGAAAALPLSSAVGLRTSPGRAALAVPVAVAVAVAAGVLPAWLAARADPVESVRPPVLAARRGRQPGGITALALVNVLRTPGRAAAGAISLAVGVAALTMLAAVTFAFRGVLVGSLLGNAVAVQVRGVDYAATAATVALGVLAVADVIFLNIRERAGELATIRAFGWRESALARLVVTEAVAIGLAGSLVGAAAGLAAAFSFAGQAPARLYLVAAATVAVGALVTAAAALLPAQALRRLPAAHLLAQE